MSTGSGNLESYALSFGPIDVPAGEERTQCVTRRLGNMAPIHVHEITNKLVGVSHHMIVYKSNATQETTDPVNCQPFADTLTGGSGGPLMITQKHDETLDLPAGIAFGLDANQMIRLEVHFINPTQETQSIEAHATFVVMPESDFQNAAGFLFAGTPNVSLAPNQSSTVHQFIGMPSDLYGKNFFGFTGHVHHLGTNVRVGMGSSAQSNVPVYDVPNFSWSEPPTEYHDPPAVLGQGDGFDLTCDYNNTTSNQVGFGESANDEMCFFWAYYYPDAGAKIIF